MKPRQKIWDINFFDTTVKYFYITIVKKFEGFTNKKF